jgi:beta-xylosidase
MLPSFSLICCIQWMRKPRLPRRLLSAGLLPLLLAVTTVAASIALHASQDPAAAGYTNPILFSDYSDPDVLRVGDRYYLVASTFHFVPGIPILESRDLVHWTIKGHAVARLEMDPRYDLKAGNGYGKGIWAPALREHKGRFYIYFPTPTEGIYVTTAASMSGPWTKPVAVIHEPNLEDPCPFWDDDGSAYLVHSKTGAGPLILHRMAPDGLSVLDTGKEIVRDAKELPTLEGPKFYKRGGYYYIFAPIGGVGEGSQAVLRSKSIWGPYEHRIVLAQGGTNINGPHQGGYVETPDGKGWFVHFQSRGAHGRIVHLEPVRWQDDWPVMGTAVDASAPTTPGEPVATYPRKPVDISGDSNSPQTSDEFAAIALGPQWEWNHNPDDARWSLTARPGFLRLIPGEAESFLKARNSLTRQMQDNSLEFTVRMETAHMKESVHAGLAMLEENPSGLEVVQSAGLHQIAFFHGKTEGVDGPELHVDSVQLRVTIHGDHAAYAYSLDDGKTFTGLGGEVEIRFAFWKGARPALFAYQTAPTTDAGAVDFDWGHYRPLPN